MSGDTACGREAGRHDRGHEKSDPLRMVGSCRAGLGGTGATGGPLEKHSGGHCSVGGHHFAARRGDPCGGIRGVGGWRTGGLAQSGCQNRGSAGENPHHLHHLPKPSFDPKVELDLQISPDSKTLEGTWKNSLGRKGPVKFVKVEAESAPKITAEEVPAAEGPATETETKP